MKWLIYSCIAVLLLVTPIQIWASEEYNQAEDDYDFQINQYRSAYDDYLVKQEQFDRIDSFANQESLLSSGKSMLTTRADVWLAYWEAINILLSETPGVDSGKRSELEERINIEVEEIQQHRVRLAAMDNLEDLSREANWLNNLDLQYRNLAYETLLAVRFGRYNWALAQLEAYVSTLDKNIHVQIRDQEIQNTRLRGLSEVRSLLSENRVAFDELIKKYLNQQSDHMEPLYDDAMEDLIEPYDEMGRIADLLVELSEGTEL